MNKTGSERRRAASALDRRMLAKQINDISGRAVIVGLALLAVFLFQVQAILLPFVLAGAVAYAATPLVDRITARLNWPRSAVALSLFVIIMAVVGALAAVGLPPLIRAMLRFATDLQGIVERTVAQALGAGPFALFGRTTNAKEIAQEFADSVRGWFSEIGDIAAFAGVGFAALIGIILTVVLLGFFLVGGPQIARGLFWLAPPRRRPLVEHLWSRIDPVLRRYLVGLSIVAAYSGCVAYLGLGLVLDVPHAGALALMTGVLEFIPLAGPISAAVIAGLVALAHSPSLTTVIAFAAYATLLRVSIDEFLAPLVLGRAAYIQPVLVIFALLTGGALFGLPGIILAVPVALSAKAVLATIYGEADAPE